MEKRQSCRQMLSTFIPRKTSLLPMMVWRSVPTTRSLLSFRVRRRNTNLRQLDRSAQPLMERRRRVLKVRHRLILMKATMRASSRNGSSHENYVRVPRFPALYAFSSDYSYSTI